VPRQSVEKESRLHSRPDATTFQEKTVKTSLKTLKNLTALVLAVAATSGAWAQGATPGVDQRQDNQQARIAQGAASGALTGREQRRLQREQRGIARAEAHAKTDGTVTPQERRRLHRKQNAASADIAHQKHDRQHARKPAGAASAP
jgi:hypothetical protein